MTTTRRKLIAAMVGVLSIAGVMFGSQELRSASARPVTPAGVSAAPHGGVGEGESLQQSFIRISEEVGPCVVSISTEQIERVRQYFRVHPFFGFGEDPYEDFFRQFEGEQGQGQGPGREFHRFGLGSGFIIDPSGYILTNEHVVADADKITVALADGREFTGEIKGKDTRSDLAVIKINAKDLPVARLGDSSTVHAGQWAIALGNPFGLMGSGPSARSIGTEPTLTVGVVSALERQLPRMSRQDRDYAGLIQTDAAINPGNSGGPLLNLSGEVIGINVAILTSSRGYEGIGFAITANKAKRVLEALIAGRKVEYGWLGLQIQDVTPDVAEYYGLKDQRGVVVFQVLPGSPAERAGIKTGDVIRTVDGKPIEHSRQLVDLVSGIKVGRKIEVELLRESQPQKVSVEIGERPAEVELAEGGVTSEAWRGLKVANLSSEWLERANLPPGTPGVIVAEVESDSPAEQAGLRSGDLINEINRQRIENLDEYRQAIGAIRGNALVRTNRGYFVIKAGG